MLSQKVHKMYMVGVCLLLYMCRWWINASPTVRSRCMKMEITAGLDAFWEWRSWSTMNKWCKVAEGVEGEFFDCCSSPLLTNILCLPVFSFNSLGCTWCKIDLTRFILSSSTAISSTLFCQVPSESNSNSLCMYILPMWIYVHVLFVRHPAFESHFIVFCYCFIVLLFFHSMFCLQYPSCMSEGIWK